MSTFMLYVLFVVVPNFGQALTIIFCGLAVAFIVFSIGFGVAKSESDEKFAKFCGKFVRMILIFLVPSLLLACAIPDKKDIIMIYGAKYITNSKQVASLPENTAKALNKLLTDYLKKESKQEK